jgi:hypothetical protein
MLDTERPQRWVCSSRHRPEPATARIAGRSATTTSGSVHRVALELCKERQGWRVKAAALNERPTAQSVADFCNEICQKRKLLLRRSQRGSALASTQSEALDAVR